MSILNNTTQLELLLEEVNALPEAGGVDLPELTNAGTSADLLQDKQLIDGEGNVVTGTFTIDNELSAQDDLIAQIKATVNSLPDAGGGGTDFETCSLTINSTIFSQANPGRLSAVTYKNNTFEHIFMYMYGNTITIENVICESVITLCTPSSPLLSFENAVVHSAIFSQQVLFIRLTAPSGEAATITVNADY